MPSRKLNDNTLEDTQRKQAEMESFIKKALNSTYYTENKECLLYYLAPEFVRCDYIKKELDLRYKIKPWEMNPQQSCHGGIAAAMIDTSMGMLTHFFAPDSFISTVSLTVNYLKPIPQASSVITKVRAGSWGRTIVSLTTELYVEETGILASTAVATYIILRGKPTQLSVGGNEK